ncbi:MBL fold metallo-hydrolase [Parvularcula oceani]|uniref:MBL fold metallo-hydrolase n=1 Tax=Parvularcula oceani TaxID=1247963 RepID=UPI00068D3079|nr:MBL fold metallo-hydrolase [Parvularcula oceani]
MPVDVQAFFEPETHTVSYLVSDPATGDAAVIDPVLDFDPNAAQTGTRSADHILDAVREKGLALRWILETHAHADHLSAARILAQRTGARIGIGARIDAVQKTFAPLFGVDGREAGPEAFDHLFEDGETFSLGGLTVRVLHTPGHTPACVSYLIGDAVFVGDTLFMPDYGTARADFPGGDARTLYRSIQKLLALPPATRMFVGHDYLPEGRTEFAWETSVGEQRDRNIHVGGGVSEDAFVRLREARDASLAAPRLILPSLQVNIRAGDLPKAEADGRVYLKLPVNALGGAGRSEPPGVPRDSSDSAS